MHRACGDFTLRAVFKVGVPRVLRGVSAGLMATGLCLSLAACADDTRYPSLSKIDDVGTVLTPEERQKAVEDLKKQEKAHYAGAQKTASN
jgi:hypothetical protein